MRFKVPQFIDIEDKLFGPFTFKQFAYLAGGAGIIFVIYKILPLWIGIFLMAPIAIITYLLAFQKVNNRPFIHYFQSAINYFISSRLYVWKQRTINGDKNKENDMNLTRQRPIIPISETNSIHTLSRDLDINEKIN